HAPGEAGGEVVRVAFQWRAAREELFGRELLARPARSGDEPERDRRRARAQSAGARDGRRPLEGKPLGRCDQAERADADVSRVGRLVPLADLDLVPEVERRRRTVEAGPEVRRGRRRADPHSRSAASGSFSPWPVMTQTTRPPGRTVATPARPAA